MKSSPSRAFSSTLSPDAQPFFSRLRSSSAVVNQAPAPAPAPVPDANHAIAPNTCQDQYCAYTCHFYDSWAPSPLSATPSSYPSPSSTLKKLQVQIACHPSSKLSPDDDSLIDSPCYKGRNWSQITPVHMGEMSPPPRVTVTVEKLADDHNISVAVTTIASLMVSHEKDNGLSVPVSLGFLRAPFHIAFSGDHPIKQKLDPGSNREGTLQTIVDLSNMLLQIPLNSADISDSDDKMLKVILEDLKKLLEEYKKGYLRKLAKAYRLDKEEGKTNTCSASCSQPQNCYIDDNEDNIEAIVYRNLWITAEIKKHDMKCKLQHAQMAVDTGTNN